MFLVVAVLARLHKTWSVVDYVLLKIERYEPLMVNDIEKLNLSSARAVDTASKPMKDVGSTKKRKKRAAAAAASPGPAGSEPEPAAAAGNSSSAVKLRTDRARRDELAEGDWWNPLYLTLCCSLILLVTVSTSSVERCRRVAGPSTDLSALLCLALVAMSTRYLLAFAYTGEAGSAEVNLLLKLGIAGFIFAGLCNVFLDTGAADAYLEFQVNHGGRLLGVAVHTWMASVAQRFPDYLPLEAMENLKAPPDTANLQMFLTVLLLPLVAAAWTIAVTFFCSRSAHFFRSLFADFLPAFRSLSARFSLTFRQTFAYFSLAFCSQVFFPAVRYGRLYSFISDRRNERLGYALRLAHWYNFYSPLIISSLWLRPIARGLYVDYFDWCSNETFERFRLCFVVASALLRMALLPGSIQEQCSRSVTMVYEAMPAPATIPDLERLQRHIHFVRYFTTGYACQYVCPASALLGCALLLWRRTIPDTSLGLCDVAHSVTAGAYDMRGPGGGTTAPPGILLSPDCAASLVGYLVWMLNTVWFICTAWGRSIGSTAIIGDATNTRA